MLRALCSSWTCMGTASTSSAPTTSALTTVSCCNKYLKKNMKSHRIRGCQDFKDQGERTLTAIVG